jgi:hypothetical protein
MISNTETAIDLKWIPENQPSLFIPHVFANISESRIRRILDELALGEITRIDMVERTNERGPYKRVYIHFTRWYMNEDAENARRKLLSGKEIKIVYDEPWFWKVSANRATQEKKKPKKIHAKPRLEMSDDEEEEKRFERTERRREDRRQMEETDEHEIDDRFMTTENVEQLHPNVTVRRKRVQKKVNMVEDDEN